MPQWIFDKISPSGKTSGGNTSDELLEAGLDGVFERESGSNSGDQVLDTSKPVRLHYDLIELTGSSKKDFLDTMDWKTLKKHLKACTKESNKNLARRVEKGIQQVEGPNLLCLRVSDYNAKGLSGDEEDEDSNFHLFSKATLESGSNAERQGSFGLGKGVFWSFSEISTVLISSTVPKKGSANLSTRIFGRSELRSHKCKTQNWNKSNKWDTTGFFGKEKIQNYDHRAVSCWENSPNLSKDLMLERDLEQGTSVLTIAYNDPKKEEDESPAEILQKIEGHIKQWLWPGISKRNITPLLEVRVRHFVNNVIKSDNLVDTAGWEPFEESAYSPQNSNKLNASRDIAERVIKIDIPEKTEDPDKHASFEGEAKLRIIRSDNSYDEHPKRNHIAHLRRNLCVVQYEDISKLNNTEDPVFGNLLIGRSLLTGSKDNNVKVHNFLRTAEPPLHNRWTYYKKLKYDYKRGYKTAITNFLRQVSLKSREMLIEKVDVSDSDFSHLSKDFKFGTAGENENPKARSLQIVNANLSNNIWFIEAKLNNLKDDNLDWSTKFQCRYAADNGSKIDLDLIVKTVSSGGNSSFLEPTQVDAKKTVDSIIINFEAKCSPLFSSSQNKILAIELTEIPLSL